MKKLLLAIIAVGFLQAENYSYTKIGSSVAYQNIGFGYRMKNEEALTGKDFSFNSNVNLPILTQGHILAAPSIKYTTLKYSPPSHSSRYFGVGFELLLPVSYGYGWTVAPVPLPNIELVWGTERNHLRFSQFGVNVLPVAMVLGGATAVFYGSEERTRARKLSQSDIGFLTAAAASTALFSYSVGF
ncbi:MAG: hypothetical protein MRY21_06945 [Simkaniaceae bacterium]|nr:hypothetical protein [Simkaniaceae bacterium]